jgi:hypothetical protein
LARARVCVCVCVVDQQPTSPLVFLSADLTHRKRTYNHGERGRRWVFNGEISGFTHTHTHTRKIGSSRKGGFGKCRFLRLGEYGEYVVFGLTYDIPLCCAWLPFLVQLAIEIHQFSKQCGMFGGVLVSSSQPPGQPYHISQIFTYHQS